MGSRAPHRASIRGRARERLSRAWSSSSPGTGSLYRLPLACTWSPGVLDRQNHQNPLSPTTSCHAAAALCCSPLPATHSPLRVLVSCPSAAHASLSSSPPLCHYSRVSLVPPGPPCLLPPPSPCGPSISHPIRYAPSNQ